MGDAAGRRAQSPTVPIGGEAPPEPSAGDLVPARLGRYEIRRELGRGGMGVVYVAWDPELDREVAVKLLRARGRDGSGREGARLQREARAMAQLSHPNVIAVYDVGEADGEVFVAMELVTGQSLRAWSRAAPRQTIEVVDVFVQAGRGLAAAHAAGLVHRDFKPSNVLVGDDGRVRVLDFGLAVGAGAVSDPRRSSFDPSVASEDPSRDGWPSDSAVGRVTETGVVLGTPGYMAPEQHAGAPADARSDQFSFCVALWEALAGQRPFAGRRLADLGRQKLDGPPRDDPKIAALPPSIRDTLGRGLRPAPSERFASMDELLVALTGRRKIPTAAIIGVLALGGLAAALIWPRGSGPCDGDPMAERWSPQIRAEVRDALTASTPATSERVVARLDAFADEWRSARAETCTRDLPPAAYDAAMDCLRRGRVAHDTLVDLLRSADAEVGRHAVRAVASLPVVESCAAVDDHESRTPPPPAEIRDDVLAVQDALTRTSTLVDAGDLDHAEAELDVAYARALDLPYAALHAEAHLRRAALANARGDAEGAAVHLEQAYLAAMEGEHGEPAVVAASALAWVLAERLARPDDATVWVEHARAAQQRFDTPPTLNATVEHNLGNVAWARGDFEGARDRYRTALKIRTSDLPPGDLQTASTHVNLGNAYIRLDEPQLAREHFEAGLKITEDALGPDHLELAGTLTNLGFALERLGDLEGARRAYARALPLFERLGPDHPNVGIALNNLGSLQLAQERWAEALASFERAFAILDASLEDGHPQLALVLFNLGTAKNRLGRHAEAKHDIERALRIHHDAYGADQPGDLTALRELAGASLKLGDRATARDAIDRAIRLATAADASAEDLEDLRQVQRQAAAEDTEPTP